MSSVDKTWCSLVSNANHPQVDCGWEENLPGTENELYGKHYRQAKDCMKNVAGGLQTG